MRRAWIATAIAALAFSAGFSDLLWAQTAPRRAPARVIVTPQAPAARPYPSPFPYDYPGPGYSRACTSWLAEEARPSGTVVVPRMHCEWVRS